MYEWIYELMKLKGFSQTKLSKVSNVAQSNLSIYCNKAHTIEASTMLTRLRLSKAFDMTVEDFEKYLGIDSTDLVASAKQRGDYTLYEVK